MLMRRISPSAFISYAGHDWRAPVPGRSNVRMFVAFRSSHSAGQSYSLAPGVRARSDRIDYSKSCGVTSNSRSCLGLSESPSNEILLSPTFNGNGPTSTCFPDSSFGSAFLVVIAFIISLDFERAHKFVICFLVYTSEKRQLATFNPQSATRSVGIFHLRWSNCVCRFAQRLERWPSG
jgi:hypothetical protein